MAEQIHELMTLKETADLLRTHVSTLYRHSRQGKIPGAFKLGWDWRFDRATIERWTLSGGAPLEAIQNGLEQRGLKVI